jgi:hypothetical protein
MTKSTSAAAATIDLAAVAEELRTELGHCRGHLASAVVHALRVGDLLRQAKDHVAHGEWRAWLESNCALSERQAQKYMQLAEHRGELDQDDPDWPTKLTINGALRRLRKLLDRTEEAAPPPQVPAAQEKDDEDENSGNDAEVLKVHQQRCRRLKRFRPGGRPAKVDLPVIEAVDRNMEAFTREVVRLARKHGRSLCKKEELGDADSDFVAMVLFSKLESDPARYFAPQQAS